MKLNSKNTIASLNAAKHKENNVYVTIYLLYSATTGS